MNKTAARERKWLIYTVHNFWKIISWFILRVFHFTKVINAKNIPLKGGYIAAANHSSFWDPPLMGIGSWRRVFRFMARDTLFNVPVWGWMMEKMGAIPVKRGAVDRDAWTRVIDALKDGWIVGMYPEGTRTPDGEIKAGRAGVGMMAYRAKCGIIPVYIHNSYKAWPKGKLLPKPFVPLTVIYGEPFTVEDLLAKEESKEVYRQITDRIMEHILKLRDDFTAPKK
ncbi:MAG: 1-acyl-sn-glycerol-3-phosphate acyltransferase [Spirochaetia bacterium]|nr:1-acyl-sn-glycerol-3-phosphate acyltransferase [Spirochaetia bacterium]